MQNDIQRQKLYIYLIYFALAAIVTTQWNFVYSGIMALPVLNSVIVATFFLGNCLVWKSLLSLDNEIKALGLIAEAYGDTHSGEITDEVLAARQKRCDQKAVVLKTPHLLGSAFAMLMDEFWHRRSLRFRLETVQMLISTVDHKLARERSLVGYIAGLTIFLGLIGTFIGLMEMVQSVGTIIGSLAGANASAESIQVLIKSLQAPLTGMAQGFSASLFGLFSSLTLGLVARFANTASYGVKERFESWLTGISQMEDVRRNDGRAREADHQTRTEPHSLIGVGLVGDQLSLALARAADAQNKQAEKLAALTERFEALAINHAALDEILRRTDLLAQEVNYWRQASTQDQRALRAATEDGFAVLRQIAGDAQAQSGALAGQLEALRTAFDSKLDIVDRRFGEVANAQRAGQAAFEASFEEAQRGRDAFAADQAARQADMVAGVRRLEAQLAMAPDPTLIAATIRGVLLEGFGDLARQLNERPLAAAAPMQDEVVKEIRALDHSLSQGLSDIATAFRNTLELYAELMRRNASVHMDTQPVQARDAG